jgi:hypothetical protein
MTDKDIAAQKRYEFISGQHGGYWRHDFISSFYIRSRQKSEFLSLFIPLD